MKRVGIIARCDRTGLGIQSKEFFNHIPCKALVIDVHKLPATENTKQNHHWYPGQIIVPIEKRLRIPVEVIEEFLNYIDVLFSFETPYDDSIFAICKNRGIKTILQPNFEFLYYPSDNPLPDLFAAPSMWRYEEIPDPKIFLPVPVNTSNFSPVKKEKTFLHIAGKPVIHDRNGTFVFLESLKYVRNKITAIINCQHELKIPQIPKHINLITDFSNKENYWENYTCGIMVMPRKFGGLCLPVGEALAAEMPVIMPDISPNNKWLPREWLVPARCETSFMCSREIDIFETNPVALAEKIDQFCDAEFYNNAVQKAIGIKNKISWKALLPEYEKILNQ